MRLKRYIIPTTLLLFAVFFCLIAIPNHLCFKTYCYDLGLYTKAAYDYAHLHVCDSSIATYNPICILADHFDLWLVLLAPLVLLAGPYALIGAQIAMALIGAIGMYKLVLLYVPNHRTMAYLAMVSMLCFFGLWQAIAFDYHSNMCAAMLLPWLLWAVKKRRWAWMATFTLLICVAKETEALWLIFVFAALLIDYWKQPATRRWLLGAMAFSIVYLITITQFVMPSLPGAQNANGWWRYNYMGNNIKDITLWSISHPWQLIQNFFTDFTTTPSGHMSPLKLHCLILLLASGMILLPLKPNYLIMIIPPLVLKWLSKDAGFWGVTFHYNVEFGPIITAGAFIVISRAKKRNLRLISASVLTLCTLLSSIHTCVAQEPHSRTENVCVWDKLHYNNPNLDCQSVRRIISLIPPQASVCANTFLIPHLACRDSVYNFPIGMAHNPEYYLLYNAPHWSYYDDEYEMVQQLVSDHNHYKMIANNGTIYLLQRRQSSSHSNFVWMHNNRFYCTDTTWFPIMINYKPDFDNNVLIPPIRYGDTAFQQHFNTIASWGFNSVRLCIDKLNISDTTLFFKSLDQVLCAADNAGLKVMLLISPPLDDAQIQFTKTIMHRYSQNATVWAYDMMNEPLYFDPIPDRPKIDAIKIVNQWRMLRDTYAPHQLFTIGFAEPIEVFEWDASLLPVDFIEIHTYHPLRVVNEMYWYGKYCGRPWMVGETSLPADGDSIAYNKEGIYMAETMSAAVANGAIGYGWWEYADHPYGVNFEAKYSGILDNRQQAKFDVASIISQFKNETPYRAPYHSCNYYNMLAYSNICIHGIIIDNDNGTPIEGAVIRGWNDDWSVGVNTFCDSLGQFTLISNDCCTHFEYSAPGYECIKTDLTPTYPQAINHDSLPLRTREYQTISYLPYLASPTSILHFNPNLFPTPTTKGTLGTLKLKRL